MVVPNRLFWFVKYARFSQVRDMSRDFARHAVVDLFEEPKHETHTLVIHALADFE